MAGIRDVSSFPSELLKECEGLRNVVLGYHEKRSDGKGIIGGDIEHLYQKSIQAGILNESEVPPTAAEAVALSQVAETDAAQSVNAKKKKSKGTPSRLNSVLDVKKETRASLTPKHSPQSSKVTPTARPQSAFAPRSLNTSVVSPLANGQRSQTLTKKSSGDFERLLRPTTSSSAKRIEEKEKIFVTPPLTKKTTTTPTSTKSMMGDAGAGAAGASPAGGGGDAGIPNLKEQFCAFSKFGDAASDGKQITLSNADKWMKQAHVIDKKITTTDTSIAFKKLFKTSKKVGFEDFKRYIEDLCKGKGVDEKEMLNKLTMCGAPGLSHATKSAHADVVSRLTDTTKYTGSSKERFDATGKGRGIEGRRDVKDNSGYVAAFKDKVDGQTPPHK